MDSQNYFHISVTGQIELIIYPICPTNSAVFFRYDVVAGSDWKLVSGISSGISQSSSKGNGKLSNTIVFNMPIEFTYKSTNIYGWPNILLSFYGRNWWGIESQQGYSRIHIPLSGTITTITAPILTAKSSNIWSSLASWFSDRNPELNDLKILLDEEKLKSLCFESYGEVRLQLQTISRSL